MDAINTFFKVLFAYFTFQLFYSQGSSQITVVPDIILYNITIVPPADLYLMQNQRQYAANIKNLEKAVGEFKKHFFAGFEILQHFNQLLETKEHELQNYMNPLETVGSVFSHCVQKYRHRIQNIATVKVNLGNCILKGNTVYPSLVATAESVIKNLKTYTTSTEAAAIKACGQKSTNHESNAYLTCIMAVVKASTAYMSTNTNTFYNHLNSASCTGNLRIKEIFDCHSAIYTSALNSLTEARALTDNCIAGNELCPSCSEDEVNQVSGRCPYQMSWHLNDSDLQSESIKNPFKGMSQSTPCLQINFIQKHLVVVK